MYVYAFIHYTSIITVIAYGICVSNCCHSRAHSNVMHANARRKEKWSWWNAAFGQSSLACCVKEITEMNGLIFKPTAFMTAFLCFPLFFFLVFLNVKNKSVLLLWSRSITDLKKRKTGFLLTHEKRRLVDVSKESFWLFSGNSDVVLKSIISD